ncbi:MAG TPA: acyl-CoA dehydrogenase family protein [Myxococcaceae bacterium]|nr:acyl-CoA dehydrogenase family protein [Myxococcaceae bacterium]
MDFSTPPRVAELLPAIRAFVNERIQPLERRMSEGWSALEPELERVRVEVKRRGWWAPHFHSEHGGMGLSLMEFAFISEELGRTPLGHYSFHCQAPDVGNMEILHEFGTPEQKRTWLEPLAAGRIRSCFSMTEPAMAGSNPAWMGTQARLEGGHWQIDGRKWFTTAADGAAFAIVMAVTDPEHPSVYSRASQIIVPMDTPGVRLVRNIAVMGEAGSGWASHGEITYEKVRVPAANLLGESGAGFVIAQARLGPGRIHHCMRWIGICQRAFDLLCDRAVSRELSPGRPLGLKGTIQQWIAESRAEIDSARLLVLHAAWRIDQDGAFTARDDISMIKFLVANTLFRVLDRAIQAHGALGITDDTPLAWWFRHERGARIYDGPDEVHQAAVARHILQARGLSDRRGGS